MKQEINKFFGKRLKKLRLEKNLSQSELAKDFNISQRLISNYENSDVEPTMTLLVKFSEYFNVKIDYLFGLDELTRTEISKKFDYNYFLEREKNNYFLVSTKEPEMPIFNENMFDEETWNYLYNLDYKK